MPVNETAHDGISRRRFLKYCGTIAAALSLGPSAVPKIAEALTGQRPPVIWLHFSECTGCSEAFLRVPDLDALLLESISLDYHETVMWASGAQALAAQEETFTNHYGNYVLIVEGSTPTAQGGIHGMVGGKTMLEHLEDTFAGAAVTIAFGSCASYGGLPAAAGGATGSMGVEGALGLPMGSGQVINIPGCPPNPLNLSAAIVKYIMGDAITLDSKGRPVDFYGKTVHQLCDAPHGCLEGYGCKGKVAYNNCPSLQFNDSSWCIKGEHHCVGCSEPNFWDAHSPFYNAMWVNMFSTYRSKAISNRGAAAFCTGSGCHSTSMYDNEKSKRGTKLSLLGHGEHEVESYDRKVRDLLHTNVSCANCHDAPGGTTHELDD